MKYEYYNPSLERGGCIPRAISKALNINYSDVKNDLIKLSIKLKKDDYHDLLFSKLILNENDSLLDLGCGEGSITYL